MPLLTLFPHQTSKEYEDFLQKQPGGQEQPSKKVKSNLLALPAPGIAGPADEQEETPPPTTPEQGFEVSVESGSRTPDSSAPAAEVDLVTPQKCPSEAAAPVVQSEVGVEAPAEGELEEGS